MLKTVENLKGYSIQATDGEIGHIEDIYFEEDTWLVRYFVVNVGNWLIKDEVLLVPSAITGVNEDNEKLLVGLTREQVENSPDVETEMPISRQREIELFEHYGWDPYWDLPGTAGVHAAAYGTYPARPTAAGVPTKKVEDKPAQTAVSETPPEPTTDLRSSDEVIGYDVQAHDEETGHVEDFIVDTEHWVIRYMVVDTRDWLPGRKVIISPAWISGIGWARSEVYVSITQKAIENSPEYEPEALNRAYETRLYEHYGRTKYWES